MVRLDDGAALLTWDNSAWVASTKVVYESGRELRTGVS
jgi:hypothetical protein